MSGSNDPGLQYISKHSQELMEHSATYLDTKNFNNGTYGLNGKTSTNKKMKEPPPDYLHFRRKTSPGDNDGYQSDSSLDSTGNKKSFKRLIVRFADKTSMQGVPYINNAKKPLAKLIWIVLLLMAIGWMVFHLFYLCSQYYDFPKQTKIKLSFSKLSMPSVTVCNVNLIRKSKLNMASKHIQNFVKRTDPGRFNPGGPKPTPPGGSAGGSGGNKGGDSGGNTVISGENASESEGNAGGNGGNTGGSGGNTGGIGGNTGGSGGNTGRSGGNKGGNVGNNNGSGGSNPPTGRKKRFVDDLKDISLDNHTDYKHEEKDHRGRERDTLTRLDEILTDLYLKEPRKRRIAMGHQIEDMLVSCSFDGYKCYADLVFKQQLRSFADEMTKLCQHGNYVLRNFTLFQSPEYGNCFTINSSEFIATSSGPKSGLTLILYMQNDQYIGGLTHGIGARVVIHTHGSIPFPDDEGFYVASAYETHIGMKKVKIKREGFPYGTCEEGTDFQTKYNIMYSRMICQRLCQQDHIIKTCGCFEDKNQELFYYTRMVDKKVCRNRKEIKCMVNILEELKNNTKTCSCDNPCREDLYVTSISSRQWPTEVYSTVLMQSMCDQFPGLCKQIVAMKHDRSQLSQNFMKLTIYYEDLNYEEIYEVPEIELAQFVSDVGGAVGLWIGLSILSIFELIQLLVELVQYAIHICLYRNAKRKGTAKKPNT